MERDTSKGVNKLFPTTEVNLSVNNNPTAIKVLVQDYHDLYREGFAMLLRIHGIMVTGEVQNGIDVLQAINPTNPPDIAVINYKTSKLESLNTACLVKRIYPNIKVIINSQFHYSIPVELIKGMGIEGIIIKAIHSTPQMIDAIRIVYNGGRFFSFTPSE